MGVLAVRIRKPSSDVSGSGDKGGLSTASIVTALMLGKDVRMASSSNVTRMMETCNDSMVRFITENWCNVSSRRVGSAT